MARLSAERTLGPRPHGPVQGGNDERPRVLVFAYACEPGRGSEPGVGWVWARMIARIGEAWVITRANNAQAIESHLSDVPERERLHFVYVDLPPWARWWKRGQRGLRLYYILWQLVALRRARSLARTSRFDLVWHVTLGNVWLGALGVLTGPPFVLGPVGGGVGLPWRMATALGARGVLVETARACARAAGRYANPAARLAWRRAKLILVNNEETRRWLPARHRSKAVVFPHAVLDEQVTATPRPRPGNRTALFAGRLLPWKGAALAVEAMRLLPEWRLLICGAGPDETRLRRLARRWELDGRVSFLGQTPRNEVMRLMAEEADVLILPSMHDDAPLVVVEALACGLPTVCLDRGGPPALGGHPVRVGRVRETIERLAQAIPSVQPAGGDPPRLSQIVGHLLETLRDFGLPSIGSIPNPPRAHTTRVPAATAGDGS